MKITKRQLRRIIRESLLLEYEQYVYRTKNGELRIKDDDGNDEAADHLEDQYDYLQPGQGETLLGTQGGRRNYRRSTYRPSYRGRRRR